MQDIQYTLMNQLEDHHWWFVARTQFITAYLSKFEGKHVLDLGCGTGGMTTYLERYGKVERYEENPIAVKALETKSIPFIKANIQNIKPKKSSFDLVCILDVLYHQHITDIQKVLNLAYESLKPGGYILITDCALPFLYSRHDISVHAARRFYLGELRSYLQQSGFIVERSSYTFFFIFPLTLIVKVIAKFKSINTVTDPPSSINWILRCICSIEAFLLHHVSFPIGSSVILYARKPNT